MSKTRMGKRVASLLLSLVMMLSLLPTTVYATSGTGETKNAIVEETNTSDDNTVGGTTGNPELTGEDEGGGGTIGSEGETAAVATIGSATYESLDEAITAVADGETIVVNAGEYTLNGSLNYMGKAFTIAAADGADVSFDMSAAVALHGAKITFNNVTFDYKTNGNYIGLQHADTLVYDNCTINGVVFLYAVNETFNNCTFNQESADAYNVWTYGAQNVAFNGCTFNCVGKAVLVYNEGAIAKTDLTVTDTKFVASAPVTGKAAIEIDTSLMAGGATITVDDKTTDTGFATGSNSGKTLWNDKKQTADTNKNTTVTVAGETVFEPKATVVKPVSVNGTSYETLEDAIDAATPDANGVVTYEISGKVDVTATGWVQVAKSGLTGLTAVKFVGTTDDAKICINGGLAILADQNYDIDVSFEALALSKLNPTYGGDYGHSTNYFTTWLRNSGAAENTVTYTNCTFPSGVSNNQYGKTVFDNCKFTNDATGLYNLWNYGGSTEIKNSSFTGTRGIKAYSEGVDGGQIEVADTTFNGLGEKAAIVVSKATTVTLNKVDATECTKGLLQKDIDGGSLKTTIEANGTGISGKFDITATTTADAAKNEFNISAGTFTSEVSNDYCADGFEVKANNNSTYGVKAGAYVAQIGDVKYETLQAAIDAVKANETIYVLGNIDLGTDELSTYDVKTTVKNVTIDLGGYTVTSAGRFTVYLKVNGWTIQNGTIQNTNASTTYGTLYVGGSSNSTTLKNLTVESKTNGVQFAIASSKNGIKASITVEDGTKISGNYGVYMKGQPKPWRDTRDGQEILNVNGGEITGTTAAIAVFGAGKGNTKAGVIVNINGGKVYSDSYAIAGNGSSVLENTTINISGGKVFSNKDTAIYHPQAGTVTISGGEVYGVTGGVQMCAGTLNVTGGTISATGNGDVSGKTGDGSIPDGAAVSIVNRAYPAGAPTMTISGGTFTSAAGVGAVQAYGWKNNSQQTWDKPNASVSGGTFSSAVKEEYCATGYIPKDNGDGTYGVKEGVYVAKVDNVKYDTLQAAINAAQATKGGATITLLKNINTKSYYTVNGDNPVTIDLAGYNITGSGISGLFYVTAKGDLTIKGKGTVTAVEDNGAAMAVWVRSPIAKVTLEGGTYTQQITNTADPHFDLIYVERGNVYVKGGTYKGATPDWTLNCYDEHYQSKEANIEVTGGTFVGFDPANNKAEGEGTSFVPAGYVSTKGADGNFVVTEVKVAEVNGVAYATLSEAIAAANAGDTVKLLRDINTPEISYVISKSLTIDLNGMTVTGSGYDAVFQIDNADAKVVIKNGKVVAVEQSGSAGKYTMAIWASKAGCEVTLEGLDVSQKITHTDDPQMDMIYASGGTITINSGNFVSGTPAWTLNCNDTSYKNGTAKIIVTGGTFVGFDPANNKAEGENTNFVAAGYVSNMNEDGSYTVVPEDAKITVNKSLTLGNTLTMTYKVLLPEGYTSEKMVFEFYNDDIKGYDTVEVLNGNYNNTTKRYEFAFTGINPQRMNDTLKAKMYAKDANGNEVIYSVDDYSVAMYCNALLSSEANKDGKYTKLIASLVAYGTASQKYMNYRTDTLVSSIVDAGAADDYTAQLAAVQAVNNRIPGTGVTIKAKSLVLTNAFAIRVKFVLDSNVSIDDVYFTVNSDSTQHKEFKQSTLSDGTVCYYFDYTGLNASELDDAFTFTAHTGTGTGDALTYNANTYLNGMYKVLTDRGDTTSALYEIVTALFNYGWTCDQF